MTRRSRSSGCVSLSPSTALVPTRTEADSLLSRPQVYDACLAKHALTEAPFPANGPPPSNFTNMVARAVLRAAGGSGRAAARRARFTLGANDTHDAEQQAFDELDSQKWPHSLKSTRLKILALCASTSLEPLLAHERRADLRRLLARRQGASSWTSRRGHAQAGRPGRDAQASSAARPPGQHGLPPRRAQHEQHRSVRPRLHCVSFTSLR